MVSEDIIVFDNLKGRMKLVSSIKMTLILLQEHRPSSIQEWRSLKDLDAGPKTGGNKPLSEADFS